MKFKVGIWLKDEYAATSGGGSSYYHRLIQYLDQYSFSEDLEISFIKETDKNKSSLNKEVLVLPEKSSFIINILRSISIFLAIFPGGAIIKDFINRFVIDRNKHAIWSEFLSEKVHLIYYPIHDQRVLANFPFISTNWDIGHISTHAFPEMSANGIFLSRDRRSKNIISQSIFTFVESEAGKNDLIKYYSLPKEKLKVVPIFAGNVIERKASSLIVNGLQKHKYFLYPAQFWPHKNHYNLILAFKKYKTSFQDETKLVFTGSDKGNLDYLKTVCLECEVDDDVLFLGFVTQDTLNSLYSNALSLVMPSFLGPTNMPLLEARELGCPVLCSDIAGQREMLENGALFFNPLDSHSIFETLQSIRIPSLREGLLAKAKIVNETSKFKVSYSVKCIETYFLEAKDIRMCWGKTKGTKSLNIREVF